jgi:hypothetical protein
MKRSPLLRMAVAAALLGAGAAGAALGSGACIRTESYVYSAQKYDPAADCLAAYAPVELVTGSGASATCPATCLTVGSDLYVSTMCPPLPVIATSVDSDAGDCIAALAAAMRDGGACGAGDRGSGTDGGAGDASNAADAGGTDAADASGGD